MSNSLGACGDERSRHAANLGYQGAIRMPARLFRMYLRKPHLSVSECWIEAGGMKTVACFGWGMCVRRERRRYPRMTAAPLRN
jgi:hypothetical protein